MPFRTQASRVTMLLLLSFVALVACATPAATPTTAPVQPPVATSAPAAIAVPATTAPTAAPTTAPVVKLHVAYSAIAVPQLPMWVAFEQGLFKKYGLEVTLDYVATSQVLAASMLANEVQIAQLAEDGIITSGLEGADLTILAPSTDHLLFSLYVRPGSGIEKVQDLKGKKVGMTQRNSATDFAARWLISHNGMKPDQDVTLLGMGGVPQILTGLQSGAIDAGVLSPPTTFQADQQGMKELVDYATLDLPFYQSAVVARKSWIKGNPNVVRRFMQAYVEGIAALKKDKAMAKQVLGKYSKTTDDTVLEQTYGVFVKILPNAPIPTSQAIQVGLDEVAATNAKAKTADPNQFFDPSWVTELDKSGFISALYK
ncbi:MAG: ABC transporter substrate-binding protein [Acidobacteriota bacterium]